MPVVESRKRWRRERANWVEQVFSPVSFIIKGMMMNKDMEQISGKVTESMEVRGLWAPVISIKTQEQLHFAFSSFSEEY